MTPADAEQVPFSRPSVGTEEAERVAEVVQSGWLTAGPRVESFEEQFADRVDREEAVAVHSCTSALLLCLQALDLDPGDEVIIPALTWPSAVAACLFLDLVPVLADVDPETLNITPATIEDSLSERSRAIVPVHFAGLPYDVDGVSDLAEREGLAIVDDAAHALGARWRDRPVGDRATAACYSFHPIKNMTTGEGGMVATDDTELADRVRRLRLLGVDRDAWKRYGSEETSGYDVTHLSLKHNMTDMQAALGLVQLEKVDRLNERRRRLAYRYLDELEGLPGLILPHPADEDRTHSWHLFVVRTREIEGPRSRDSVAAQLEREGVSTGLHFLSVTDLSYYQEALDVVPEDTPVATRAGRSVMSLPLFPDLDERAQDRVIASLRDAMA